MYRRIATTVASGGNALSVGAGAAIRVWDPIKTQDENGSAADMGERFAKAGHTRYLPFPAGKPVFAMTLVDGQTYSAGGDRIVRQHDLATGKLVKEWTGPSDWVYSINTHTATNRMAVGTFNGRVHVWDTKTGNPVLQFIAAPGLAK